MEMMKHICIWILICLYGHSVAEPNFWVKTNGPSEKAVIVLALNSKDHLFAGVATGGLEAYGLYRSTDDGERWEPLLATGYVASIVINDRDHVFAGTGVGVFRSLDHGDTWSRINDGFILNTNIGSMDINSTGTIYPLVSSGQIGRGLYYSTNNGDLWQHLANPTVNYLNIVSINSNDDIFTSDNFNVYRSTDKGKTWAHADSGLTVRDVNAFAFKSAKEAFAGTGMAGMFRTRNNGDYWEQINVGLHDTEILSLIVNSLGYIFAGTNGGGVYRSTDDGDSWIQVNAGLMDNRITSLSANSQGTVFVGTTSGAVYRSVEPTTVMERPGIVLPSSFALYQNYPNPFNSTTVIAFSVPYASDVKIKIFNVLGEKVVTLLSKKLDSGIYKAKWSPAGTVPGIYFCCLESDGFVQVKRMALVE